MKKLTRVSLWSGAVLAGLFVAIQFVPVNRVNPPVETDAPSTAEAHAVLKRACYDCHSNETVWPWYSHVAPVSWLVARDVSKGREELNFSTWNRLDTQERVKILKKSWEEVQDGEMPLWFYLPPHPSARLTAADREVLRAWSLVAHTQATGAP